MVNQVRAGVSGGTETRHKWQQCHGWHKQPAAFAKRDGWPECVQVILSVSVLTLNHSAWE